MKPATNNEHVFAMSFASVYPYYVHKVVGKGRTVEELHTVITWLTGYDEQGIGQGDRRQDRTSDVPVPYPKAISGSVLGAAHSALRQRAISWVPWLNTRVSLLTANPSTVGNAAYRAVSCSMSGQAIKVECSSPKRNPPVAVVW